MEGQPLAARAGRPVLMEGAPEEAWDPGSRVASPMADGRDHHSSEPPLSPIASVRVLKRIPRASREQAGLKPATVLEGVVSKNDVPAWERVLHFGTRCLRLTFPIDLRESQ